MGGLFGGAPRPNDNTLLPPVPAGEDSIPLGPPLRRASTLFTDEGGGSRVLATGNRSVPLSPLPRIGPPPIAEIAPVVGRASTLLSEEDGSNAVPRVTT